MRTYQIFLIKKEFADYFYGRENKIYELFNAKRLTNGQLNEIIQRQIQYITLPLPYLELHRHLSYFVQQKSLYIKGTVYCTTLRSESKNRAELLVEERTIQLNAWGSYESESILFEMLRKFDGRFFAMDMDMDGDRFGWIKPMKERKLV